MCSLFAHDRLQTNYQEDDISIGDKVIPKNATVDALHSLGATFIFIDIWLHTLIKIFFVQKHSYETAMGEMFKTTPKNDGIKLTSSEKNQRLITDIGGGWYLDKCKKKILH